MATTACSSESKHRTPKRRERDHSREYKDASKPKPKLQVPWRFSDELKTRIEKHFGELYELADTNFRACRAVTPPNPFCQAEIIGLQSTANKVIADFATIETLALQSMLVGAAGGVLAGRRYLGKGKGPDERWDGEYVYRGSIPVRTYQHDWLRGDTCFNVGGRWYVAVATVEQALGLSELICVRIESSEAPGPIPLSEAIFKLRHVGPVDAPEIVITAFSDAYYCKLQLEAGPAVRVPKELLVNLSCASSLRPRGPELYQSLALVAKAWAKQNEVSMTQTEVTVAVMVACYIDLESSAETIAQYSDRFAVAQDKFNTIITHKAETNTWWGWFKHNTVGSMGFAVAARKLFVRVWKFCKRHPAVAPGTLGVATALLGIYRWRRGARGAILGDGLLDVAVEEVIKKVAPGSVHAIAWFEFAARGPYVPLWANALTVAMHYVTNLMPLPLAIGAHYGYNQLWDESPQTTVVGQWFAKHVPALNRGYRLTTVNGMLRSGICDLTNPILADEKADNMELENFVVHVPKIVLPGGNTYVMPHVPRLYNSPCLVAVGIHCPPYAPRSLSRHYANEEAAIVLRHGSYLASPDERELGRFITWVRRNIDNILPIGRVEAVRFSEWNDRFPKGRREAHRAAFDRVRSDGYCARTVARSKAFVKIERLVTKSPLIEAPDPRLIQGTTDESNVIIGPWMYGFSKRLAEVWNGITHNIMYVSGCHTDDFSRVVHDYGAGGGVVFVENDFSRFDSTMSTPMLELETWIYAKCGAPKPVLELLREKYKTRGTTSCGIKYKIEGTRKSGEPNTSCGNTLINALLHAYCLGDQQYLMLALGDDNLVVGPSKLYVDFQPMVRLGFKPKTKITRDPFDVEFCSMTIYPVKGGWLFTPKIGRLLAKMPYDYANAPQHVLRQRMRANILGLYADVQHIELMRGILDHLLELLPAGGRVVQDKKIHARKPFKPNDETLYVFLNRYDISLEDVATVLKAYRSVTRLPKSIFCPLVQRIIARDC